VVDYLKYWAKRTGIPLSSFTTWLDISSKILEWVEKRGIRPDHIQPGKPQQNAYIERYNRTVRYDWLAQYLFDTIEEVQEYASRWL